MWFYYSFYFIFLFFFWFYYRSLFVYLQGNHLLPAILDSPDEAPLHHHHHQAQEHKHPGLGHVVVPVLQVRHERQRELQPRVDENVQEIDEPQPGEAQVLCNQQMG